MTLKKFFRGALLFLLVPAGLTALEIFQTGASMIQSAAYVAHVRVDSSTAISAAAGIRDFRLSVLENLKGRLPQSIRVRLLISSRIIEPDGRPDPPGSEWIVILGKKRGGLYPLQSLRFGKIEIFEHPESGRKFLARPLTGLKGKSSRAKYYSLNEFRIRVKQLARVKRR